MEQSSSFSTLLVTLIILIIIFLAFRFVNLWYWKIDKAINLFTTNNELLEKILLELKENASLKSKKLITKNEIAKQSNEGLNEILKKKEVAKKTPKEIAKEELLNREISKLKENLNDDEMIIRMKQNKELKIIKKSQYELDKDLHLSGKYLVVFKN